MSTRKALEDLLTIVEIHQKSTGNNFAWAEVEYAKELLEQTEQEPDYYLWHYEVHDEHPTNEGDPDVYPLYLTPPKREPLSHEEINECMETSDSFGFNGDVYIADGDNAFENFARAIEKAHGIGDK